MDNTATVIVILTVLGSVFGFYTKIKKDIVSEQEFKNEPIRELNTSIIKLNASIDFLNKTIDTLKERVTNHGKEIDCLKLKTENQEVRIDKLEQELKK